MLHVHVCLIVAILSFLVCVYVHMGQIPVVCPDSGRQRLCLVFSIPFRLVVTTGSYSRYQFTLNKFT